MKAKMYIAGEKMEIRLSDDTLYAPKKGEAKEKFVARIGKIVKDDYLEEEFELIEITKETVEANDDTSLLDAVETATGLQKQLIEEVLKDRKLIAEKKPREKVKKIPADEMKASDHYKECEANIGKYVSFSPFKSTEVYEGEIRGVALNKTNTRVYYTVVDAPGVRRCCAVLNETIKFIEAPIKEVKKGAEAAVAAGEVAGQAAAGGEDLS